MENTLENINNKYHPSKQNMPTEGLMSVIRPPCIANKYTSTVLIKAEKENRYSYRMDYLHKVYLYVCILI